jgi:hypothetical protein
MASHQRPSIALTLRPAEKYRDMAIVVTSKPIAEYRSEGYFTLDLARGALLNIIPPRVGAPASFWRSHPS